MRGALPRKGNRKISNNPAIAAVPSGARGHARQAPPRKGNRKISNNPAIATVP